MDHTQWIYLICFVNGLLATFLFTGELIKKWPAKPSNVFICVMLFAIGVTVTTSINFAARELRHEYGIYLSEYWFWPFRWYPTMIAMVYLNVHLIRKLSGYTEEP